jgi:hypothetical protein
MKNFLFFVLVLFATTNSDAQNIITDKAVMVTYFKHADHTDAATNADILFWAVSSVPNTETGQIEIVATPFNRQRRAIVSERINGIYVKNPFNTPTDKVVIVTSNGETVTFSSYITDME